MKKSLCIFFSALLLNACTTTQQAKTPADKPDHTGVITPADPAPSSDILNTQETDANATQNASAHTPSTIENDSTQTSQQPNQQETQELIATTDLWQRIRQGYQLPYYSSPLVTEYENWHRRHNEYLVKMLSRADKYLFHIVEEIEKRNMPMELALLPAVESAFKAKALSRSNASGLWQFIPATGRYLGMRQDWWSDQRRDVLLSTNAALDYLQALHKEFDNDWLLALAAYNGGKGTIGKAIRRNRAQNKATTFGHLTLRNETKRYVPKLIALSNVVMNPDLYGVTLPTIKNQAYFAVQSMPGQSDLVALVKNTSLTRHDIDELNPLFLRWASDPKGPHRLLVPLEDQASVANYFEKNAHLSQLNWREHRIRKGDTVSGIAKRYAVSHQAIRSVNGMKNNRLRAGKTLLIPLQAFSRSDASSTSRNTASNPSSKRLASNADTQTHRVTHGDTLWHIARRYGISLADLLSWNQLSRSNVLSLNQVLVVSKN